MFERAEQVLTENREALTRIAEALLVKEVLGAEEIKALLAGEVADAADFPAEPEAPVGETNAGAEPEPAAESATEPEDSDTRQPRLDFGEDEG